MIYFIVGSVILVLLVMIIFPEMPDNPDIMLSILIALLAGTLLATKFL